MRELAISCRRAFAADLVMYSLSANNERIGECFDAPVTMCTRSHVQSGAGIAENPKSDETHTMVHLVFPTSGEGSWFGVDNVTDTQRRDTYLGDPVQKASTFPLQVER